MPPLSFQEAKLQYNPDPFFVVKADSEAYNAIYKIMIKSGFVPIDAALKREFHVPMLNPHNGHEQPINRPIPIINQPPMSKKEWLADSDNRKAFVKHIRREL